jgi:4-amino-4-deoxy-L-arabinose transferase-like glycosyltransferase
VNPTLLLFLGSLALRVLAVLVIGEYRNPNVWESGRIAAALVAGHGFAFDWRAMFGAPVEPLAASTWWPPAYPAFLAACHVVAPGAPYLAASLAQAALSALVPLLLLAMGRRLFGARAGWIAAVLAAVHPPLVGFAALIQTALLEIVLTAAALWLALRAQDAARPQEPMQAPGSLREQEPPRVRERPRMPAGGPRAARDAFAAGVATAAAGLTRPPALALLAVAPFAWRASGAPARAAARRWAAMLAGAAILLAPWVARNRAVRGEWVLVSSNGGWNLYVGNNPAGTADRADLAGSVPPAFRDTLMTMNEVEGDRFLRRRALDFIRAHPAETARRVTERARNLLWFNETFGTSSGYSRVLRGTTRAVYQTSWALLLPAALAGMILTRRDARRHVLLYGAIAANAAVILATFFVNRYRAPIEPILILFAAAAIDRALAALARRVADPD